MATVDATTCFPAFPSMNSTSFVGFAKRLYSFDNILGISLLQEELSYLPKGI
jgi:hypothetical protein